MMIPGSNLLDEAFECVATQEINYFRNINREQNEIGEFIAEYAEPEIIEASVQAVDRNTYQYLGLDLQKNYVKVFVPIKAIDLSRDVSGDQFEFYGKRYQCESQTDWYNVDGWCSVLCNEIRP